MITVDEKYKARPITKPMAIDNFYQGELVLAIVGENERVQIFMPGHHDITALLATKYADAKWYADWATV